MRIMLEVKECSARYYIGAGTSPFCIATRGFHTHLFQFTNCSDCGYGKRHVICDDEEGNDYEAFCDCLDEDQGEEILDHHLALADGVITEFVNSRLTSTPQLE